MVTEIGLKLLEVFPWLSNYVLLVAFLAPIIGGGEFGIIAVGFLFANSRITFIEITILSCLGMIFIDSFWFLVSRTRLFAGFRRWNKTSRGYKIMERSVEKVFRGSDFLTIVAMKVMAGTRILMTIYLSGRKIKYSLFLLYNSISNIIWAFVLVLVGYLASKGYTKIISIFNNLGLAITFLIAVLIIMYSIQQWMNKEIMMEAKTS